MDFVKKLEDLDLTNNPTENWEDFKDNFKIFLVAAGLDNETDEKKIAVFLNQIGKAARNTFKTFEISNEDSKSINKVFDAFDRYCASKSNTLYDRFMFYKRKQEAGEPFEDFLIDLRKLVKPCKFPEESNMLRDHIVMGLTDKKLRDKLIKTEELDYEKAVMMIRMAEKETTREQMEKETNVWEIKEDRRHWRGERKFTYTNKLRTDHTYRNHGGQRAEARQQNSSSESGAANYVKNCLYCAASHRRGSCPAYGQKCGICNKENHIAIACKNKKVKVNIINQIDDRSDFFCFSLYSNENNLCNSRWWERIRLNDTLIRFKLDSGSDANIITKEIFEQVRGNNQMGSTNIKLKAFGGEEIIPLGSCDLMCAYGNNVSVEQFIIVANNFVPILGLKACLSLRLIQRVEVVNVAGQKVDTKEKFLKVFEESFKGIGCFPELHKIELVEGAEGCIKPPRRVPMKLKEKLKAKLEELVCLNIISPVSTPRNWVSNLVIVRKQDGTIRLCLDPVALNKSIKKEKFLLPTVEEITARIGTACFFSVLDIKNGFWHVKLDALSAELCTFTTPFGNFQFNRLPFGITTAPEVFQKMITQNFGDLPGILIYMDDILVMGKTKEEHDENLKNVLIRAQQKNIKFNQDKFQYCVPKVKYLGLVFDGKNIEMDRSRIESIEKLKMPNTKAEVQKFLGVVNYIRNFIPNLAELSTPLRELLKKDTIFKWTESHSKVVDKIKEEICKATSLAPFDPENPIVIQSDSSQNGIGCCLIQNNKVVSFASRALSEREKRYAQIEKELLSVLFAVNKFHYWIYGQEITIQNDHKPLASLIKKDIHKVPSSKLQRMLMKLWKYDIKLEWVPGKFMHIADYLSRNYLEGEVWGEEKGIEETVLSVDITVNSENEVKEETAKDGILKNIMSYCREGWPKTKDKCPDIIKPWYRMKESIHLDEGILFYENRIIIPAKMQNKILKLLHESHFGITKTKKRAKDIIFWIGMDRDIENLILNCNICQEFQSRCQKEPMITQEAPSLPWQKIGCDIAEYGNENYLITIDYYSKWIDVKKLKNKSAAEIKKQWIEIFAEHGIPVTIIADNNPFPAGEIQEFLRNWNVELRTRSPHYPKGNALAERAVGIIKAMLKKSKTQEDFYTALMEYRNTPVKDMTYSPSQLLNNRRLRTKLPISKTLLEPQINTRVQQQHSNKINNYRTYYNKHAKIKKDFQNGQQIYIHQQGRWIRGKILRKGPTPRSYIVEDENNNTYRRNSAVIRSHPESSLKNCQKKKYQENNKKQNEVGSKTRSGRIYKCT